MWLLGAASPRARFGKGWIFWVAAAVCMLVTLARNRADGHGLDLDQSWGVVVSSYVRSGLTRASDLEWTYKKDTVGHA